MKTLVLTNDTIFFRKTNDGQKLQLNWNLPINFQEHKFQYVSVYNLSVFPMKPDKRYEPHWVSMNIIDCGVANPLQKIGFVLTDPFRRFFSLTETGESLMTSSLRIEQNFLEFRGN